MLSPRNIQTIATALAVALAFHLVVGAADAAFYVWAVGHAPNPLMAPGYLLSYGGAGICSGLLAGLAAVLTGGGAPRAAGFAAGLSSALTTLALVFFRWLPDHISIGTPVGLAAALAALLIAGVFALLCARWIPRSIPARTLLWAGLGCGVLTTLFLGRPAPLGSFTESPPSQLEDKPDILLLVLDTLRADRLAAYGNRDALDPNLEKLAAASVTFSHSLSVSNHTPPPHASLLTGLYPARHGVNDAQRRFSRANTTIAELLSDAGWATFAVVANFQLQAHMGWDQGFQVYNDQLISRDLATAWVQRTPVAALATKMGLPIARWLVSTATAAGLTPPASAERVVDLSLETIDAVGDRPYFGFLNLMEPHFPYLPPGVEVEGGARQTNRELRQILGTGFRVEGGIDEGLLKRIRTLYDGEVRALDQEVGRLLQGLEERGRLERTLIVVTSDHGEHLGEHGYMLHAYTLNKAVVDVPLLIHPPGAWSGARRGVADHRPVCSVDVAATVLDAAGIEAPTQGRSLLPVLRAESRILPEEQAVAQWYSRRVIAWDQYRAYFKGGTLTRVSHADDDLKDLSEDQPELAADAWRRYALWEADNSAGVATMDTTSEGSAQDMAKRLRALGYLE